MKTTFKELKELVKDSKVSVAFGCFCRNDQEKNERVFCRFCTLSPRFVQELLLPDDYEVEVYVAGTYWTANLNADVNPKVDTLMVVRESLVDDLKALYARKRFCVNMRVLKLASKELRHWMLQRGYLNDKNRICYHGLFGGEKRTDDNEECTKEARHTLGLAKRAFCSWLKRNYVAESKYFVFVAAQEKAKKEEVRREKKRKEMEKRDRAYVESRIEGGLSIPNVLTLLNVGSHCSFYGSVGDANEVYCSEHTDWEGYAKSCRFPLIRREFHLKLKKGYRIHVIGGLITFVRGKLDRRGVHCEWAEQGRALADIRMVKGYLVRGEHIEAGSLKEAKRINAEHRKEQAIALLTIRATEARKKKKLQGYMFTFDDSLASGNCRAGTQAFKNRVEAAVGHEVNELELDDLCKYGRQFGLELYTNRVINYVFKKRLS